MDSANDGPSSVSRIKSKSSVEFAVIISEPPNGFVSTVSSASRMLSSFE